mgnify:CR=1 FL=1
MAPKSRKSRRPGHCRAVADAAAEKIRWWLERLPVLVVVAGDLTMDGYRGEFDQFAGATITPRAVVKAVHKALQYFDANQEQLFAAQVKSNG